MSNFLIQTWVHSCYLHLQSLTDSPWKWCLEDDPLLSGRKIIQSRWKNSSNQHVRRVREIPVCIYISTNVCQNWHAKACLYMIYILLLRVYVHIYIYVHGTGAHNANQNSIQYIHICTYYINISIYMHIFFVTILQSSTNDYTSTMARSNSTMAPKRRLGGAPTSTSSKEDTAVQRPCCKMLTWAGGNQNFRKLTSWGW